MSMNLGTQTPSLTNWMMAKSKQPKPEVGMGATLPGYTDRHAATVIEVISDKKIVVQEDKAIRVDDRGMCDSQEYRYEPDPHAPKTVFTLRKNGQWIAAGQSMRSGQVVALGHRSAYHDYSY